MYPKSYFDTYWRTDLRAEVFVAMPFHDEFGPTWSDLIQPSVELDQPQRLRAHRVDATVLSGSIITEILDGIAHARLVLGDISTAADGKWKGQRNGNVLYEIGVAHAVRQETEVLLLKADDEPANFDLLGIRVHQYRRDRPADSRPLLARLITSTLEEVDAAKSLMVQRAVDALDGESTDYIAQFGSAAAFQGPAPATMGEELIAISNRAALARLQSLGIIRRSPGGTAQPHTFRWTEFGRAVVRYLQSTAG